MRTFKKLLAVLLCVIMTFGTVAVGGGGFAQLFDAVSVEASADVFNIVAKSSANISTTVTLEPCMSGSSLRRVPVYTLTAYAWVEGLPENTRSDQDPVFSWYFVNSNHESIFLGTSDVFQTSYNDAGETLTENVFSKQINRDEIFDWSGSIYATVEFAGTNYDLINGQVLTTNKSTISVVNQTVYAQCVRVEGKTYTNSEGKTYVKEVKPEGSINYSNNCYLGSSEQPDGYYYTVKFFPNENCLEKERLFINYDNDWHYQNSLNNSVELNEPYKYEDYIKESENGGLVGTSGFLSGNETKCYNKVTFITADGSAGYMRVGTFDDYSGCRNFTTVTLSVSVNTDYQPINLDIDTTRGKCGDNLYWSFDADTYTLTISGTGDMYDYGVKPQYDSYGNVPYDYSPEDAYMNNPAPWDAFRTKIRKIYIQPSCTSVGDFAFYRCWYVTGIAFPEGVTKIGNFICSSSYYSITKLFLPSSLESIGNRFFYGGDMSIVHRINISYGGTEEQFNSRFQSLAYSAFGGERSHIGYFYNVRFSDEYSYSVDENTNAAKIVAYFGCSEQIDIPSEIDGYTVTGIGMFSFFECDFSTEVTIPESVTSIEVGAFTFSGIENFYIPKNVKQIGQIAFLSQKTNLAEYASEYGIDTFANGMPRCEIIPNENGNGYINRFNNEPAYTSKLISISVDPNNPYFSNDDNGVLYNKSKTVLFQYPIGSSRKSFVIPDAVTSVWSYAFKTGGYSELERIYIPRSVSILALNPFDDGLILDYAGTQFEWNNLVVSSYPTYPIIPSDNNYGAEYEEYLKLVNDLILNTQKYNYYFEAWNENDGFGIDHCTINFNVTDPMNGVTPDSITYSWSSDGSSCTGTAVYNDFNHTVTENATVTSRVYSNATCTAPGTTRYTATFNNTVFSTQYKDIQNISALGHSKKWVVTTTATCTREGVESYKCSRCGTVFETRKIDKLPHSYSSTVVNPTCTKGGYTTHTCSSCGDTYTDSYTSAAGHRYTDYITKPTCTAQGYTLHYCSVCHDSYKDNYTPPAHTPGNPVVENATNSSCETEGSYDEVVYCTKCGNEISREHKITVAGQHTPAEAVKENQVAATCEKAGSYDLVVYCAICNNELSRQTVTVPKSDHKDTNNDGMCDTCKKVTDEAKYKAYLFGKVRINVKSDEVYKNSKVTVIAKASGVPNGYVLAIYDGGSKPAATGDSTSVTYEMSELVAQNKTLTVKVIDASGKVQKDGSGKELSAKIEIKVKTGFFDLIVAFFRKLFGANKVTIKP